MAPAETGAESRRGAARGSRRRSREMALQALYEWLLAGHDAQTLCSQAKESESTRGRPVHLEDIGAWGDRARRAICTPVSQPFLDRPAAVVEPGRARAAADRRLRADRCPDVPYRVVINEAVELAKCYGGTDGHKYVNGVLDKLAAQVRPAESRR